MPAWPGVTVTLVVGGVDVDTTVADGAGAYSFTGVTPGNVTIRVDPQSSPNPLHETQFGSNTGVVVGGGATTVDVSCSF